MHVPLQWPLGYVPLQWSCGVTAAVLRKARMAWNTLDQSDAPRFQDPSSSDVATACSHERGDGLQP